MILILLYWLLSIFNVQSSENLEVRLERVYRQACARRRWWIVRYCAAKLRKVTNSLAPGITSMLVRGKQVSKFFC